MKKSKLVNIAALLAASLFLFSCQKDDDDPEPIEEDLPPIELSCDYFDEDQTLVDDPQRPIDYFIDCTVKLETKLMIEPGVIIIFGKGAGIIVQSDGSLSASGMANDSIVFTATQPQNGWWGGLEFRSDNNNNKIAFAKIYYAGATSGTGGIGGTGDVGYGAVLVHAAASLQLTQSTISNSGDVGLSIAPRGGSGNSHQPIIDRISLSGNTYTANTAPLRIPLYLVGNLDPNDTYSGNQNDNVRIRRGNIEKAIVSMKALDVPYMVEGNLTIHRGGDGSRSHLTIEPGVEILMGSGTGISVLDGPNYLSILGTAAQPINIKGADPIPGSWNQIKYNHSGPAGQTYNKISHTEISHGNASEASDLWNGVVSLNLNNILFISLQDVHFTNYSGTSCPVGGSGDWDRLVFSNLTDDQNRLPACIGD